MKTKLVMTLFALFALLLPGSMHGAAQMEALAVPLGTAITYQGRLGDGGLPANGAYDLQFTLYNAAVGGAQVGSLVTKGDVPVSDGYFTVQLDFGAGAFGSEARWLEVAVRLGTSSGSYTVLSPRQPLTPAPSAMYALTAGSLPWSGLTGVPAGFADGIDNDTQYTAGTGLTLTSGQFSLTATYRLPQGCSNGQIPKWNGSAWVCAADETGVGGSSWSLTGNAGTNPSSNYLGTSDNQPFEIRVNGLRALRVEPAPLLSPNIVAGYNGNTITAGISGATISGGGGGNYGPNRVTDIDCTVGGGENNLAGNNNANISDAAVATVSGGLGNTANGYAATVSGGVGNTASGHAATTSGGLSNTASGMYATVSGGYLNLAQAAYATISGGGPADPNNTSTTNNRVFDDYGTIGGGGNNRAGSDDGNKTSSRYGTIGGGVNNFAIGAGATVGGGDTNHAFGNHSTISGGEGNWSSGGDYGTVGGGSGNHADAIYTTVGGGHGNLATFGDATIAGGTYNSAEGGYATVGGGYHNSVGNQAATVAGGWDNTANGNASTVPGGANNEASGAYSFAAGADGHATHDGSFVWSSASRTDSYGVQTFTVRAPGGVRFYSGSGTTTGARLLSGDGMFASLSDRNSKFNISPVNDQQVLEKVAALSLSTWSYLSQDASIVHMGPMAQDFAAAFGLGADEHYIGTLDADGVALAAIQGLYQLNQQQAAEIQSLKARISRMEKSASTPTPGSFPFVWIVVGLLGTSQVGLFLVLRRRMGAKS